MTPPKVKVSPRILLAKIGLDGHDRGIKVLARVLRDHGAEVIYTGLWQTCEATMHAALQEDVDVVGVSLLSAAHMTVMPELLRIRHELGVDQVPVVLGGIVPESDHAPLRDMGVAAVFNPGSSSEVIVDKIFELAAQRQRLTWIEFETLWDQLDLRALAHWITAIVREQVVDEIPETRGSATVIGVTGSPGVGKSSFIAKFGQSLRSRGYRVAVVAVDPTSPITGGALLGDRLRMMSGKPDGDFFIRSLSSRSASGGLAPHAAGVVAAIDRFGFDIILVETVGAGQGDTAIRELTDEVVLVLMPGAGDAVQFAKSGIMEIATCFVINKCDLPGGDVTLADLRANVGTELPIFQISAVRNEGFDAVTDWAVAKLANT